jgi:hypothetical protein
MNVVRPGVALTTFARLPMCTLRRRVAVQANIWWAWVQEATVDTADPLHEYIWDGITCFMAADAQHTCRQTYLAKTSIVRNKFYFVSCSSQATIFHIQPYRNLSMLIHSRLSRYVTAQAEETGAAAWGWTSVQSRACPRMGSKQHLACWPSAAQMSMKLLMPVGEVGAVDSQ